MTEQNSDVLALLEQAVLLVRGEYVAYANPAAVAIFGDRCQGKRLPMVLDIDIPKSGSPDFITNVRIRGRGFYVHSTQQGELRVFVLKEIGNDYVPINDSILSAMRSTLMLLSMSAERCRKKAQENEQPELTEMLRMLRKNIAVSSRLIGNISIIWELSHGNLGFSPHNVDLSQLCRSCVEMMKELMPGLNFRLRLPVCCVIHGDADLLSQMLINLLSNCILHAKCRTIEVRLIDSGNPVILAVGDDGCGIPGDELYNAFDRYLSVPELKEVNRGSGFGLSVVRGIAEKHGGTILLESRVGYGTEVRVSLHRNPSSLSLHSTDQYKLQMKNLLIWAADCLPESCYEENPVHP